MRGISRLGRVAATAAAASLTLAAMAALTAGATTTATAGSGASLGYDISPGGGFSAPHARTWF